MLTIGSVEELNAINQFRELIKDSIKQTNDDHFLRRWLIAREYDQNRAREMLLNNFAWRKERPYLENIADWIAHTDVSSDITYRFTGFDNEGRPVMFLPAGRWNVRKLIEAGHKEETFKYMYKMMEEIIVRIEKARENDPKVTQIVSVFDAEELGFWKVASSETIQFALRFFREFESYYPEIINKIFVINVHWICYYAYNLVKHIMSPRTIGKIEMIKDRNTWEPTLKSTIPLNSIPQEYGGNGEPLLTMYKTK